MNRVLAFIIGAALAVAVLLANVRITWTPLLGRAQTTEGLGVTPGPAPKDLGPTEVYARAAQIAYKSVVNIDLTQRVQVRSFFFGDDLFGGPRYREAQSHGSGVIITKNGYLLTNEHVVGPAHEENTRIAVTLTDGRRFAGTVVGSDRTSDVALVKVEADNLPVAQPGTVRGLTPGQMVVAIGNPLDLRFTVSNGVVSALGRPISVEDRIYSDLIQHDALINPGNSGGPLVNMSGQVIGINTLIRPDAQGIGFAIPIDTALRVADELKRFGKVKRPWLGLVVRTNTGYFVQRYGLPDVQGAVVGGIARGGPSDGSGLEIGDVVTKIDARGVKTEDDFKAAERALQIGKTAEIEVRRPQDTARVRVKVGEAP